MSTRKPKRLAAMNITPAISPVETVATSLPPSPSAALAPLSPKQGLVKLGKNSIVRKKAMAIVALRAHGYTTEQIAVELAIKPASVNQYLWRATKAGLLVDRKTGSLLTDPKDNIEFELSHKVIRNLNEFMDSDDDDVRKEVTLEIAKGTMWKRFDPAKETAMPAMNVLAVKIEMPTSGQVDARHGAMGGSPAYAEGAAEGELIGE